MSSHSWFGVLAALSTWPISTAQSPQELSSENASASFFWGDYDGDSLADAFVVTLSAEARLLRNRGDGTLEDVTEAAGLAGTRGARFALWEDVERDGDRDLLIGILGGPSRLFQNQGDATFIDATESAGLLHTGEDLDAGFFDYDQDGLPDLHLRTQDAELLYRNLGQGFFEAVDLGLADVVESGAFAWSGAAAQPPEPTPAPRGDERSSPDDLARPSAAPIEIPPPLEPGASGRELLVPPPGGFSATMFPACAKALEDQGAPGCLYASSVPTLGRLYPLSANLFVEAATGEVGIGTTSPVARLHVAGTSRFTDDITLQDGSDTIRFPAVAAASSPMIEMFTSGTTNADRMVIAHSPGVPTYGLEYEDNGDRFVFQRGTTTPVLLVDLPNGDLLFGEDGGSIRFPAVSGSSSPMIEMFASGTTNPDRMVIAHSPSFPSYGLEYEDVGDRFVFQSSTTNPALSIDIGGGGQVGIGVADPQATLHARDTAGIEFRLEADTDNSGESDQPSILFSQDGGVIQTRVGYVDGTNEFEIRSTHDDNMVFELDTRASAAVTTADWEWSNTDFIVVVHVLNTRARLTADGDFQLDGTVSSPAADLAEMYPIEGAIEPGDVVAFAGNGSTLARAWRDNALPLAGVISSEPAFLMGQSYTDEHDVGTPPPASSDGSLVGAQHGRIERAVLHEIEVNHRAPLALAGRVPCKVSGENGPIRPGDLLTVSTIPGHAAKAIEAGPVIGTALESFDGGSGKILVFVNTGWFSPEDAHAPRIQALEAEIEDLRATVQDLQRSFQESR